MAQELTADDVKVQGPINDAKFFNIGMLPDGNGIPTISLHFSRSNCEKLIIKLTELLNQSNQTNG